ncbi:PRC-barrel domain-containing protein [Tropicibacter sp. S64]|uniref:PRC-barrel domain-containing protein n=1 Tax=Tropicibacter sp. S64 TaxID=3415122 RepID=UPI003C7C8AD3
MKRTTLTAIAALMVVPTFAVAQSSDASDDPNQPLLMEQSESADGTTLADEAQNEMAEAGQEIDEAADAAEQEIAEGAEAVEGAMDKAATEMAEGAEAVEGAMDNATTEMAETADEMTDGVTDMAQYIRARDMIDGAVYTMTESTDMVWDGDLMFDAVGENWDKVGEIEDIVLASDGSFKGVIAEVGGFLDIGDKHVMLPIDNVKLVPVDDVSYAIVTPYSLEELKSLENVDEGFWN